MRDTYTLLGCRGCGSTIVAAALELTGFPWGYEEVDYAADSPERERLLRLNPLGEVPTLILPNNEVMTESAAIVLLLHARAPHAELAPEAGAATLPRFLRWLMFINSAIYPTFTYGDHAETWLPNSRRPERLEEAIAPHREQLWLQCAAAGPTLVSAALPAADRHRRAGGAAAAAECAVPGALRPRCAAGIMRGAAQSGRCVVQPG